MAEPLTLAGLVVPNHSEVGVDFDHADLQFHRVDHSGHSYEVRVYLNNQDADEATGREPDAGYAGSFFIFGHGGCYGEEGHCDPKRRGVHAFDVRPPHPLEPTTKSLEITDSLKRIRDAGASQLDVTLVPIVRGADVPAAGPIHDELKLESVSLVTYETSGA